MVVVPIWKREATTKLVLDWYEKIDCDVLVVGSEGEKSRRMSQGPYLEAPNYPLDAKYDLGISHCRMYDPDAVALVGSDDFITGDYFEWAMSQIALGFYLTDLVNEKVFYWSGYTGTDKTSGMHRLGDAIGAGRVYSKAILDRLDWKPFGGEGQYEHMSKDDERSEKLIRDAGGKVKTINMANIGCRYWAVKTGDEINPPEAFHRAYDLVDVTQFTQEIMQLDLRVKIRKNRDRYLLC